MVVIRPPRFNYSLLSLVTLHEFKVDAVKCLDMGPREPIGASCHQCFEMLSLRPRTSLRSSSRLVTCTATTGLKSVARIMRPSEIETVSMMNPPLSHVEARDAQSQWPASHPAILLVVCLSTRMDTSRVWQKNLNDHL